MEDNTNKKITALEEQLKENNVLLKSVLDSINKKESVQISTLTYKENDAKNFISQLQNLSKLSN